MVATKPSPETRSSTAKILPLPSGSLASAEPSLSQSIAQSKCVVLERVRP
jgi:hypothetical protein